MAAVRCDYAGAHNCACAWLEYRDILLRPMCVCRAHLLQAYSFTLHSLEDKKERERDNKDDEEDEDEDEEDTSDDEDDGKAEVCRCDALRWSVPGLRVSAVLQYPT